MNSGVKRLLRIDGYDFRAFCFVAFRLTTRLKAFSRYRYRKSTNVFRKTGFKIQTNPSKIMCLSVVTLFEASENRIPIILNKLRQVVSLKAAKIFRSKTAPVYGQ